MNGLSQRQFTVPQRALPPHSPSSKRLCVRLPFLLCMPAGTKNISKQMPHLDLEAGPFRWATPHICSIMGCCFYWMWPRTRRASNLRQYGEEQNLWPSNLWTCMTNYIVSCFSAWPRTVTFIGCKLGHWASWLYHSKVCLLMVWCCRLFRRRTFWKEYWRGKPQLEGNSLATAPIPNSLADALLWHFNKARAPLRFSYSVVQNWELFREYYRRFVMISLWSGNFVHCRVFSSSLGHGKCGET